MTEQSPIYRVEVAPRLVPADPCPHCAERDAAAEIARLRVQLAEAEAHNADLLGDVARLRAGIEEQRWDHLLPCAKALAWETPPDPLRCTCGADAHNDWITTLLKEGT